LIGRRINFFNVYHGKRKRIIFVVCYCHDPNPLE
jgi:hypothetical protein